MKPETVETYQVPSAMNEPTTDNARKNWSKADIEYLRANKHKPIHELAEYFGRTWHAVKAKMIDEKVMTFDPKYDHFQLHFGFSLGSKRL